MMIARLMGMLPAVALDVVSANVEYAESIEAPVSIVIVGGFRGDTLSIIETIESPYRVSLVDGAVVDVLVDDGVDLAIERGEVRMVNDISTHRYVQ